MRRQVALITGGPIDSSAAMVVSGIDKVICADSGVDFALRNGIEIDEVFGDFDSITPEAKHYLQLHEDIIIHEFPPEKDMTDTELALRSIPKEDEITLICSLTGRIDHVITNMNLIVKLREEGYDITATDGITDVIPLSGKDYFAIPQCFDSSRLAVSLIPLSEKVTGVTSKGLYYELNNQTISFGSSFSNSNKVKDGEESFSVEIETGRLLVVITEAV